MCIKYLSDIIKKYCNTNKINPEIEIYTDEETTQRLTYNEKNRELNDVIEKCNLSYKKYMKIKYKLEQYTNNYYENDKMILFLNYFYEKNIKINNEAQWNTIVSIISEIVIKKFE